MRTLALCCWPICFWVRRPELKVSTPAHTKHLGWYLELEFRVAQGYGYVGAAHARHRAAGGGGLQRF